MAKALEDAVHKKYPPNGPTGCADLAQTLKILEVPFAVADATTLTEAGT